MAQDQSRRDFIVKAGMAGAGLYLGSGLLSSCSASKAVSMGKATTGFQQTPLPYSYNALNEAIDGTTMEIHYTKHAATYASNLQTAARNEGIDTGKPLEDVMRRVSKYTTAVRNNGGGHYNHELFWKLMTPKGGNVKGKLATSITDSFGSYDSFKTQFEDSGKARFGSGWAWLVVDGDKRLRIGSTPNQDNPLMDVSDLKGYPILGLDVWEHAYYLRYQNKRPEYIANWWKVVNWDYVGERYDAVV